MKTLFWISGACLTFLVVICAILWSRNVEIRVPKDFRGLIRIKSESTGSTPEISFFKLVIAVPASGEITLKSLNVVRRMHRQKASFSDGTPLPVAFPGDIFSGVALQVMNTPPTPQVFYFVGTRDELVAYLNENRDFLYTSNDPL